MIPNTLKDIANYIVTNGKGILAADESTGTIEKRFKSIGVKSTEENRRKYREMLFNAPAMSEAIGGVILFDETIKQVSSEGRLLIEIILEKGSLPGIKVDQGLIDFKTNNREKITQGLDGLDGRCREYASLGAKFTKWRAVINIDENIPSQECIDSNMNALAKYASIAQKNGLVPIVEPEVMMDGKHNIDRCYEVTHITLSSLFSHLSTEGVDIEGTLLKSNMVISGLKNENQASVNEVAEKTLKCLLATVPTELPGIVFLSGGQSDINATAHLDCMNKIGGNPWKLSFSYGRALQQAALKTWDGDDNNLLKAQNAFNHRALMNMKAAQGNWYEKLELQQK